MEHVVVIFANGQEIPGKTMFFNPKKFTFPLQVETGGKTEILTVRFEDVKKVLFLKSEREEGAPSAARRETIDQSAFVSTVAFKLAVEFLDGEVLTGSTLRYNPTEKGFFVTPLNPADRSERIYVSARFVKNVDQKRLLGRILVEKQMITNEQLEIAIQLQAEQRAKKIGSIMIEQTIIERNQLHESLSRQKDRNLKIGELLIEAGYITQEQCERALRIQKDYRTKKLGQILVDLKYLTPNDICIALASQLDP